MAGVPSPTSRSKAEVYLQLAADARKRISSGGVSSPASARSSGSVEGPFGLKDPCTPPSSAEQRRPFDLAELDEPVARSSPAARAAPVWDEPATPAAGYANGFTSPTSPTLHGSEPEVAGTALRMNRQLQEALEMARAAENDMAVRLQASEAAERAATAEAQQMSELAGTLKAAVTGLQADLQKKFAERSAGLQSSVVELQRELAARSAEVTELERDLSATKLELSARTSELGAAVEASRLAEQETAETARDLAAANAELRSTKQALWAAQQQLAEAAAATRELRRERDAAHEEKKMAESTLAEARFLSAEASSARSVAEAAKMSVSAKLEAAHEAVAEYQAQLAEREAALAAAEEALAVLAPDAVAAANGGRVYPAADHNVAAPPTAPRFGEVVAAPVALKPTRVPNTAGTALSDTVKAPSTASIDSLSNRESHGNARSYNREPKPMVEMFADFAIEGARVDSMLTNPAMGMAALLDFVNDWRGAISEISEARDRTPVRAMPAPAVTSPVRTPTHVAKATIVTPDFDQ